MAKTEVGLSVDVEFQSVGQMRKAIKEATGELIAMSEKFGTASKEATAAAKRVAELKDRLGDAKALADTFNPDKKFVALGGAIQGAVSGFSALQGAMGLFGSESKDLEKMLLKVQSAMALQQGISGIAGAMDSMKMLGATIKTQVVTAFSTLRGAIIATGLGALAVAIGLVIANFDKFKNAVFNLIPGLKGITDFIGGLVTKFTDFVGITSEAERNLEKISKVNKRANETIDAQIKLLELQGGKEDQIYKLKKDRIENELNTLRAANKDKKKLTDEEQKQIRDLNTEKVLLDAEERARLKKESEDKQKKLEADAEKTRQKQKEINAKNKEIQDAADKVLDDARRAKLTERQREEEDVLRAFEERKKALLLAGNKDTKAIEEQKQIELKAISDKYAEEARKKKEEEDKKAKDEADKKAKEEQDRLTKKADFLLKAADDEQLSFEQRLTKVQEREALVNQITFESEDERTAYLRANADARVKIAEQETALRIQNAQKVSQILTGLSDLFGKETAAGKATAIAAATINTYLAASQALTGIKKMNPVGATLAIAQAALVVATGIKQIAEISKVKVPSGGGGGGGGAIPSLASATAPIPAALPATATAQMVNAQAINQLGNQATRAYVLNSDIQNNDQRNAYLQRNASIG